jgi:hypothetical protein
MDILNNVNHIRFLFFIDDILYEKIFCMGDKIQFSIKLVQMQSNFKLTINVEFLWVKE